MRKTLSRLTTLALAVHAQLREEDIMNFMNKDCELNISHLLSGKCQQTFVTLFFLSRDMLDQVHGLWYGQSCECFTHKHILEAHR